MWKLGDSLDSPVRKQAGHQSRIRLMDLDQMASPLATSNLNLAPFRPHRFSRPDFGMGGHSDALTAAWGPSWLHLTLG